MSEWRNFKISPIIDAYVDWMREPGAVYTPDYLETDRVSCLVELVKGKSLDDALAFFADLPLAPLTNKSDTARRFDIPRDLFHGSLPLTSSGNFLTGFANRAFLKFVDADKEVSKFVKKITVFQKLADDVYCADCIVEEDDQTGDDERKTCGGTVVMGVIDEGIAFGHENFRRANTETRVEFAWIQDGKCRGRRSTISYGREHRKHDRQDGAGNNIEGIDSLLKNCVVAGQVDEECFYQNVGLTEFARAGHKAVARRTAHGTHVMDLTCGYEMGCSPVDHDPQSPCYGNDQRPIVCVQLPSRTIADTSGLGLEKYMIDATVYILQKAEKIAKDRNCGPLPVVINFSSGVFAGPHDGTHPIEIKIENLLRARRDQYPGVATEMVLPAGNSYLSQAHVKVELDKKASAQLTWRLQPDDKTYNFLEIWLPREKKKNNGITLQITPPGGEVCQHFGGGRENLAFKWEPDGADNGVVCKVYYEFIKDLKGKSGRGRFTVITLPTTHFDAPTRLAPSGDWKLELRNHTADEQVVHGWIQWDDRPLSYPVTGRQSYFIDREYEEYNLKTGRQTETDQQNSPIKRQGTINAIGTGKGTITIAGFYSNELRPASYSAAGETVDFAGSIDTIAKPDAAVVSDDSVVQAGILAAGSRSGSTVIMNGTSVAAPQVARWLADQLAQFPNLPAPVNRHESIGYLLVKEKAEKDELAIKKHAVEHHNPQLDKEDHQPQKATGESPLLARTGNGRMDIYQESLRPSQRLRQPEGAIR